MKICSAIFEFSNTDRQMDRKNGEANRRIFASFGYEPITGYQKRWPITTGNYVWYPVSTQNEIYEYQEVRKKQKLF
jgi:hypothetical protein